jgi:hypothetical protein
MNEQKTPKTDEELGQIMLQHHSPEDIRSGYNIDPSDVAEVGRQALLWNDIRRDGTMN